MQYLEHIYANFRDTVEKFETVPAGDETPSLQALRADLLEFIEQCLRELGRTPEKYWIRASAGQRNLNFADVPWVGVSRRDITRSARRGYYVALLFKSDMSGCYLSLNQGYREFKDAFVTSSLAKKKIREVAVAAASAMSRKTNGEIGPINLAANTEFAKGYEGGAIVSFYIDRRVLITDETFRSKLGELLELYDDLFVIAGKSLSQSLAEFTEEEYQATSNRMPGTASKKGKKQERGGAPKPAHKQSTGRGGYVRDPRVANSAISDAGYRCEIDPEHMAFLSKSSGENFVEAHHLIPMSAQADCKFSLDVEENVVALCPTCHRKLHHGTMSDRMHLVRHLLSSRHDGLLRREIDVKSPDLYRRHNTLQEGD